MLRNRADRFGIIEFDRSQHPSRPMKKPNPYYISLLALAMAACRPSTPASPNSPSSPSSGNGSSAAPSPAAVAASQDSKQIAVESRIRKIVVEQLGVNAEQVLLTVTWKSLGADSLDFVELIMAFEEEFKVEISDKSAEAMKTVGDATSYMTKHGKL